jgi:hypothetical protein
VPPGVGHNVTSVTGLAGIVPGADFRQTIRTPVGRLFFPATGLTTLAEPSLTGGCLCGGVRFELTEPAPAAGYCHCTRCQGARELPPRPRHASTGTPSGWSEAPS